MKIIPIKLPNKLASVPCYVDDEDFEELSKFNWFYHRGTRTRYAGRQRLVSDKFEKSRLLMHHVLLPPIKGKEVDHRNGNGLDNRKENLRYLSHSANGANRTHLNTNNKSGIQGVCFHKTRKLWILQIRRDRKFVVYKSFKSKEETIAAREKYEMAERGNSGTL